MIEVRHLRYMVALAREMNFTAAAKRTHVAQPALSQNIRQIEDELGVQLFERNTHKVVLTPSGKVFYREAVATLEHLERTVRATQRAAQGEGGALSIGFTTSAMLGELPSRISNFRKRYPNIEILFRELTLDSLVDALRIGAVDLGCSDIDVIDEMLESAPLKAVPVVVVLNKAHPLARHSSLRLDMLASETFILPAPDSHHSLYNTFVNACREAGFEPVDPYFVDTIPCRDWTRFRQHRDYSPTSATLVSLSRSSLSTADLAQIMAANETDLEETGFIANRHEVHIGEQTVAGSRWSRRFRPDSKQRIPLKDFFQFIIP